MAPDSGPWEDFAPTPTAGAGPWEDFAPPQVQPPQDPRRGRGVMGWLQDLPGRIGSSLAESAMAGPKGMAQSYRGEINPTGKEAAGLGLQAATMFGPVGAGARVVAPTKGLAAPSAEELADAASAGYQKLRNTNIPVPRTTADALIGAIKKKLDDRDFDAADQPATFRAIERLEDAQGRDSSAREIYKIRTKLNQIIGDNPGKSEGASAQAAMERMDEYLQTIPAFEQISRTARGNYRASMQSERVTKAADRADLQAASTGSGANAANAQRQKIRALLTNDKVPKTPEEKALMEAIVKGDRVENIARLFSKLGPSHPITGWGSVVATGGNPIPLAFGALAQWIADRGPAQKIGKLDELIRRTSPLGQQRAAAAPGRPYGVQPPRVNIAAPLTGAALGQPSGDALAPGGGDALGKQGGIFDALSPISSAQAADNPPRGKPPADTELGDPLKHGKTLALPEVGAGKGALPRQTVIPKNWRTMTSEDINKNWKSFSADERFEINSIRSPLWNEEQAAKTSTDDLRQRVRLNPTDSKAAAELEKRNK